MAAGWKGLPVVAALVLVGAVSFTLVAAATLAAGNWQGHAWQGHVWNTVLAIILWLVWFYG
jgi:hypothetical protein